MNKNKAWSILIWSIFLIWFLSFSFIYISIKIQNKISENINQSFSNSNSNTKKLFLIPNDIWLKSDETINFSFNSSNTWALEVIIWWPIEYNSWYLYEWQKKIFNNLNWNFYIKNLWWITKIKFNFESLSWVVFPYYIEKEKIDIWENELILKDKKYFNESIK